MKYILVILTVLITNVVYAEPYKCLINNAVFVDKNHCESTCGVSCEELSPSEASNAGECDTSAYKGFVSMDGKTYALSNNTTKWSVNTAKPKSEIINNLLSNILKHYKVKSAFIGVTDFNNSMSFNTVDTSRFTYSDGSAIQYSNWASGEPNNYYNSSLSGVSIYGEHWATMASDGTWQDVNETIEAPALFEWNGQLSCVVGDVKSNITTPTYSSQQCTNGIENEYGVISLSSCEIGDIFGSGETGNLCTIDKIECIKDNETYTCPYTDKPCIESSGSYYCSPYDCSDASGSLVTTEDEVPEGSNDPNNNGEINDDGECLGQVVIFPGRDMRCRPPGSQNVYAQCCKVMPIEEINKPDFRLSKDQVGLIMTSILGPGMINFLSFYGELEVNTCNSNEKSLAVNRGMGMCHYVGEYCSEYWGKKCMQKKQSYCCFDSDFSKYFAEAGYDILDKSWGSGESPNCKGFTPEELQLLSSKGISDHPKMREYAETIGADVGNELLEEFNSTIAPGITEDNLQEQVDNFLEGSSYE